MSSNCVFTSFTFLWTEKLSIHVPHGCRGIAAEFRARVGLWISKKGSKTLCEPQSQTTASIVGSRSALSIHVPTHEAAQALSSD